METPDMDFMKVLDRIRGILLDPETEWGVIADEKTTVADLYKSYIVVLAAVPAIFGFFRVSVLGVDLPLLGTYRVSLFAGLAGTILSYALSLVQVYVLALIVDALAPTFGAQKDRLQALKASAYAFTAFWVAGIGQLLPLLAVVFALAGAAYSVVLLYKGLPRTMRCGADTTMAYTAVSMIAAIILGALIGQMESAVMGTGGAMGPTGSSKTVQFDPNTPLSTINGHKDGSRGRCRGGGAAAWPCAGELTGMGSD
jgi:hypothetical protein